MHAKPLVLCLSLLLSTGVYAKQPGGQLTVVAPPENAVSYERWSDKTSDRLARSVQRSANLTGYRDATGYARVLFRLDDQGRPESVALAEPSSSRTIDRISVRAVKNVGTLTPLPQQISRNARFEAWIIVASDAWEKADMLARLRTDHKTRTMAQAAGERPVLIASR